jgi:hypothetical protein
MKTAATLSAVVLGAFLATVPAYGRMASPANHPGEGNSAQPQQNNPDTDHNGAKQDMKKAGHQSKDAAKDAGHGVKQGTKHAYHSTKRGVKKGASKTKNTTKGAVNGGKAGAKEPTNPPQ